MHKGHNLKKLCKLKEWLTVPDAAKYLSVVFGEEVTEVDVLQLALEGHLKLSIFIEDISIARPGKIVSEVESVFVSCPYLENPLRQAIRIKNFSSAQLAEFDTNFRTQIKIKEFSKNEREKLYIFHDYYFCGSNRYFVSEKPAVFLSGIFDLPMIGNEKIAVKRIFHKHIEGAEINKVKACGCFVSDKNGTIYQLQENISEVEATVEMINDGTYKEFDKKPFHKKTQEFWLERVKEKAYKKDEDYPASGLPYNSFFVVKTAALREFEQRIAESDEKNTRSVKESTRKTENLLRALTSIAIDAYNYNPNDAKSLAPQDIVYAMNQHGASFSSKTIRNWLKEGASLLELNLKKD